MASIADIRAQGVDLELERKGIEEPLTAPESLQRKLARFPEELYNVNPDSHLYRLLLSLCGEGGAGSVKKELLYSKLQSQLEATHFGDLDRLYGNPLSLPRLSDEIYDVNPKTAVLTRDEWLEVYAKDASYRNRALIWMRAIMWGGTPTGVALAAEAATGTEFDIYEQYLYEENLVSDDPITITNLGQTHSRREFVLVPRDATVTEQDKWRVMRLVDLVRPQNSLNTVYSTGIDPRTEKAIRSVTASSTASEVIRTVTGRGDVEWPDVDVEAGFWVERGVPKEAPTYAWMSRQESATFLSIADIVASSENIGPFSRVQQHLFTHLTNIPDDFYLWAASYSYTNAVTQLGLAVPWIKQDSVMVNNYYPIEYLSLVDISQFAANPPYRFWASQEKLPGQSDRLTIDFGYTRPFNFVDFEMAAKPITVTVEVSNDGSTWTEVTPIESEFNFTPEMNFSADANQWKRWNVYFELVQARYVRINFERRTDPFPLSTSEAFPFSVDVRNLRVVHVISNIDDFITDTGLDILGNEYVTSIVEWPAAEVIDDDTSTFWKCSPNPIEHAVEALYFDLSYDVTPGVTEMDDLDILDMTDLQGRSMAEVETYFEGKALVDEIYIDPVTLGATFHIYWSNDDSSDWDNKLWTPINRHYKLKKGFHALPSPVFAKYWKIEFTNLSPMPYNTLDFPEPPPVEYRKYPSWVQAYFEDTNNAFKDVGTFEPETDSITLDPYDLYQVQKDNFNSSREDIVRQPDAPTDLEVTDEISEIIQDVKNSQDAATQVQQENKIRYFPPTIWQSDLATVLDLDRPISRFLLSLQLTTDDDLFGQEAPPTAQVAPDTQSAEDLSDVVEDKNLPLMWFPRRCRHGYQVVEGNFQQKLAYIVAIREVKFYRRHYTATYDEPFYLETMDDDTTIESNDFIENGEIFQVTE